MKLYVLTSSTHADYALIGAYVGPDGVDVQALAKQWAKDHPAKAANLGSARSGREYFDGEHFRNYVEEKAGLVPVADWEELWLPDYSLDMKRMVEGQ